MKYKIGDKLKATKKLRELSDGLPVEQFTEDKIYYIVSGDMGTTVENTRYITDNNGVAWYIDDDMIDEWFERCDDDPIVRYTEAMSIVSQ